MNAGTVAALVVVLAIVSVVALVISLAVEDEPRVVGSARGEDGEGGRAEE